MPCTAAPVTESTMFSFFKKRPPAPEPVIGTPSALPLAVEAAVVETLYAEPVVAEEAPAAFVGAGQDLLALLSSVPIWDQNDSFLGISKRV